MWHKYSIFFLLSHQSRPTFVTWQRPFTLDALPVATLLTKWFGICNNCASQEAGEHTGVWCLAQRCWMTGVSTANWMNWGVDDCSDSWAMASPPIKPYVAWKVPLIFFLGILVLLHCLQNPLTVLTLCRTFVYSFASLLKERKQHTPTFRSSGDFGWVTLIILLACWRNIDYRPPVPGVPLRGSLLLILWPSYLSYTPWIRSSAGCLALWEIG